MSCHIIETVNRVARHGEVGALIKASFTTLRDATHDGHEHGKGCGHHHGQNKGH